MKQAEIRRIIDVYDHSMGWVPKTENKDLAKEIDKGRKFYVGISQKYGGNNYNYGLEVVMSTDEKVIKRLTPIDKTTLNQSPNSNKREENSTKIMNDRSLKDQDYSSKPSSAKDYDYLEDYDYNEDPNYNRIEDYPEEYDEDGERGWWADNM